MLTVPGLGIWAFIFRNNVAAQFWEKSRRRKLQLNKQSYN